MFVCTAICQSGFSQNLKVCENRYARKFPTFAQSKCAKICPRENLYEYGIQFQDRQSRVGRTSQLRAGNQRTCPLAITTTFMFMINFACDFPTHGRFQENKCFNERVNFLTRTWKICPKFVQLLLNVCLKCFKMKVFMLKF